MTIPVVVQRALIASVTGDAFRDAAGRYRLRSQGRRIAPWNRLIQALYPNPEEFDRAVSRWLALWEAVPTARLPATRGRRG